MAKYSLTDSETVVRNGDRAFIPNDPNNQDRADYDQWIEAGGVPDPFVPSPTRRLVPKSLVISRISDEQLSAALALMTVRQTERWRAPDQPAVYADDPEVLELLAAIGADPSIVLAD